MDHCLSRHSTLSPATFSSPYPPPSLLRHPLTFSPRTALNFPNNHFRSGRAASGLSIRPAGRTFPVIASAGASHCEPSSSLNSPLEPRSQPGKFLSSVLQNHRQLFHVAVAEELKLLADDRDGAVSRMLLTVGSDEACLHRRVAQLKEHECQLAVEDVMYMLIFYRFSEIKVPLVPRLSRCVYNSRLEILPSRDWELESIHSLEVLEIVREHVTTIIGLRADSSVTDYWATTKISRLMLGRVYVASVLYGYFLKSASLRHHLEQSLALANQDHHLGCRTSNQFQELCAYGVKNLVFDTVSNKQSVSYGQGSTNQGMKGEPLKCYVMGLDPETLQRCAKLKSKEAVHLIENHSCALFGDGKTGLVENDEVILTSFSSLKRLVLEAVAFGSFLWDTEEYIDTVYKLKENN
ncbi:UV-B-induced protein At3g17800, chloroplastic [Juglans microcarpa x Juglans regia]|uniref:UV-B-induced protein At3g17800, chloroplastic n=1 Tax=Juglans microcarpa x Juglans regia TaxID=2249226 RepID=UPI001B7F5921|nr:UV-B-induced protein At3g17800, chloroplastic [Juglans microcarpa x Juglans regia]